MVVLFTVGKIVFYSMFLLGLWRLLGQYIIIPTIKTLLYDIRKLSYSRRLNHVKKTTQNSSRFEKSELNRHVILLLSSISKNTVTSATNFFVLTTFIFGVTVTVVYSLAKDIGLALISGIVFMLIPYVILRVIHFSIKLKTTHAFIDNFHIIYQTYFSTGKNPYYLLMNLPNEIDDKKLKREFSKLFIGIQKASSAESVKNAVQVFSFTVQSNFGIRFGHLLYKALVEQSDISLPLRNLNEQIADRKNDLQEEKVQKTETKMTGYLAVILLPILMFVAYRFTIMYDQWKIFTANVPLVTFIISLLMTIISLFIVILYRKDRTDI